MEVIEIEKTAELSSKFDFNIYKFNLALFLRSILLLTPIYIFFYQENGLTVKDLFLFQGIFYLASIIFEIPVGYLSDNIERKNLLLISFYDIYWFLLIMVFLSWVLCNFSRRDFICYFKSYDGQCIIRISI